MRLIFTLVLISSIITHGFSDPKKPKKPKKCDTYSCSDWDWNNKKGLFDPHSIQWPLHYTGETYYDKIDGGQYDIDVVFNHYGYYTRVPLKHYRNSVYHKDPWFLDKGISMKDAVTCEEYWVDEPHWKENHCAMVDATYEDVHVYVDGPNCSKIVREWAVIDWCKWEPNSHTNTRSEKYSLVKDLNAHRVYWSYGSKPHDIEHDGWYTFKQVIKILDKYPPEMVHCEDLEIDLEGECETKVKLKNKVWDSGPCPGENMEVEIKVYKTDGFVVTNKWLHAKNEKEFWVNLGYLKAGDYLVHWSVKDGCGNHGGCTQKLKVIDKNPPHLICIQDLGTSIKDDDGATIWAKDFVHKVEGACYDEYLTYSFEPDKVVTSLTFNCPDGVGLQELEIYVTGSNGVQASCNVTLFVADHAACDPDAMQIAGKVTDKFKNPIFGAEVMVQAENRYINSGMTNDRGIYGVTGISFDLGRPEIVAKVDEQDVVKGLNGVDLILLLRHIHGIELLANSDERAAADLNSDDKIDMEDYWDLIDVMYDIPGREADIKTWKFYDAKTGLFAGYNHTRLVAPVKLARYRHDYPLIGLKTGDIDFSWRPGEVAENRSSGRSSDYSIAPLNDGQMINVQVPKTRQLKSVSLSGSNLDYQNIHGIEINGAEVTYVIEELEGENVLYILSHEDMSGATIEITADVSVTLAGYGNLYETYDESETFDSDWRLNPVNSLSSNDMVISPNPFDDRFSISYKTLDRGTGNMKIYNAAGQLIRSQTLQFDRGFNELNVSGENLVSGLYMVVLNIESKRYTSRIIKN